TMEDRLEYIDDFFKGLLSEEKAKAFEEMIVSDPAFAADVTFYLSSREVAKQLAQDEKKNRYRELFAATNGQHEEMKLGKVRKMWFVIGASATAAISTAVIFGVFFLNSPSVQEVAGQYMNKNYQELPVKMGPEDDLQKGIAMYNSGQYAQSLVQFQRVIVNDTNSFTAVKYAGLAAFKVAQYDTSFYYFK